MGGEQDTGPEPPLRDQEQSKSHIKCEMTEDGGLDISINSLGGPFPPVPKDLEQAEPMIIINRATFIHDVFGFGYMYPQTKEARFAIACKRQDGFIGFCGRIKMFKITFWDEQKD